MAVRFGVVGTAYWAREVHVPGLLAQPSVQLVGLWGRNVESVREIADPAGITPFSRFEEMLEAVYAVSIAVPPDVQAHLALIAANAGKHLLLEKPLSTVRKDAEDIAEAVSRNRLSSIVFFTRRFVPEIRECGPGGEQAGMAARDRSRPCDCLEYCQPLRELGLAPSRWGGPLGCRATRPIHALSDARVDYQHRSKSWK